MEDLSTERLALREISRRLTILRDLNDQQAKQIIELQAEISVLRAMSRASE